MVYTGQGVFTGALTTATAFLAMGLTNFKGIQEMGVICGGGMLICFVPMTTLLPVLLLRGSQNRMDQDHAGRPDLRARIESLWLQRPRPVIIATIGLCLLSLLAYPRLYFDYDLLNMQSKGLAAVVFEKKLINSTPKSVLYAAVVADTAEQAVDLEKKLLQLPTVSEIESMAPRVLGDQAEKRRIIGEIKQDISSIHFAPTDMKAVDLAELSRTLSTAGFMGAGADAAAKDDPDVAAQLVTLRDSITALRRQMWSGEEGDRYETSAKLALFQRALLNDVHDTFDELQQQDNDSPLRADDLPPSVRNRFIGVTGKFLLQVYPKADIWQRSNQEKFIKELQTVYPNATGTPVQLYYYTELLRSSYETAAWYALGAIIIMVFIHFRTFSSVVLALLPVGIGFLWLCGLMGWFHIPFNPANIMTLPLVIGIGVTNGIHILNRYAEERNPGILAKSTGKAVFVSGLTTMSGFGSLILAQHQGIRSLGEVMTLGVATCMVAGLTFLPAVLTLWVPWRDMAKKQPSDDNARSTLGREEPR